MRRGDSKARAAAVEHEAPMFDNQIAKDHGAMCGTAVNMDISILYPRRLVKGDVKLQMQRRPMIGLG
jgi:hypothetical protein